MQDARAIQVLLIEDNPGDAYIVRSQLKDAYFNTYELHHCTSLQEGLSFLARNFVEAVMLDLGLPDTSELQGLKQIAKLYPDLCTVVISGNKDQTIARYAIHNGAQDYLTKGKFDAELLDKTLTFAMERKRKESALAHAKKVMDNSPAVTFQWRNEEKWPVNLVSKNVATILGYSENEFMNGKVIYAEIIHPEDIERVADEVKNAADDLNTDHLTHRPYRVKKKNGTYIWVEDQTSIIRGNSGNALYFEGVILNITDRVLAEKESLLFKNAIDQTASSVVMTDLHGNITYVNKTFEEVTGYSSEEVMGKNPRVLKSGEHDNDFYKNLWEKISSGQSWQGELTNRRKNGEIYWEFATLDAITDESGQITGYLAIKDNISERKKDEQRIEESEKKFRFLAENIPYIYLSFNTQFEVDFINSYAMKAVGLKTAPKTVQEFQKIKHPEDLEKGNKLFPETIGKGKAFYAKVRLKMADGKYRWFSEEVTPYKNEKTGEIFKWVAIATDIHNSYTAQQKLQESEAFYRSIFDSLNIGVIVLNTASEILQINNAMCNMLEIEKSTILSLNVSIESWPVKNLLDEVIPFDEYPAVKALKLGKPVSNTIIKVESQQKEMILSVNAIPVFDEAGKAYQTINTFTDVTKKLTSELSSIENERKLDMALEATKAGWWKLNTATGEASIDRRWAAILGYSLDELIPISQQTWVNLLHPEDLEASMQYLGEFIEGKHTYYEQRFRMQHKKGHYVPILAKANVTVLDEETGHVTQMVGTNQDISDIAEAEAELIQSEEKYRFLAESLPHVLWRADPEGNINYVNKRGLEIFGVTFERLKDDGWFSILHPGDIDQVAQKWTKCTQEGTQYINEQRLKTASGDYHWFHVSAKPEIENEAIVNWVGVSTDIHEEKIAKIKLIENEQDMARGYEAAKIERFHLDIDKNRFSWTEGAKSIMHIIDEKPVNTQKQLISHVHPLDRNALEDCLHSIMKKGSARLDFRIKSTRSSTPWVSMICNKQIDPNTGKEIIKGVVQNITEIKLKEEQLNSNKQKLDNVINSVKDIVFTVDRTFHLTEIFGYDKDLFQDSLPAMIGKPVSYYFGDLSLESKTIFLQAIKEGEATYQLELRSKPYVSKRTFQVKLSRLYDEKGKVNGLIGVARDLTEDIEKNNELSRTKDRLKGLVDSSPAVLYEFDLEKGGIYYSGKVESLLGFTVDKLVRNPLLWANSILIDDKPIQQQAIKNFREKGKFNVQYRIKTSTGEIKWLRDICSGKDPNNPNLIRGVAFDITAEKQLLESVADSEKRYKRIYQNIDEGYVLLERSGEILGMNPAGMEMLGLSEKGKNSVYKKNFKSDILVSNQRFSLIEAALHTVPKLDKEVLEVKTSAGTAKILTFNFSRVTINHETGIIEGSFHDVTEDFSLSQLTTATNKIYESLDQLSKKELIQLGVDTFQELTNSKIAFFHLVNDDENTIRLTEWSTQTKEICEVPDLATHYPIKEAGIWVECVQSKQPVIHNDYQKIHKPGSLPEGHTFMTRDMEVPLLEDGRVVGIIGVGNKAYEYTDLDARQLQAFGATFWSILKRKDATEELEQTKYVLEEAQRVGNIGNWWVDLKTRENWWSETMKALHGLPKEVDTPGFEYYEQIHPEDRDELTKRFEESLEKGSYEMQYRVRRYDNKEEIILHSSGRVIFDQAGNPMQQIGVTRDVTKEVTMVDELVSSKEQLNLAIEGGKLAVLDHDLLTDTVKASDLYFEIIGRSPEEAFGHRYILDKIVHPDDREALEDLFEEVFSGSVDQYNHSYRIIRPDQSTRYIQRIGKVLFNEDKQAYRSVGVVIDITNRRTLENQLIDSNRQITSLIESIPGLVFRCNIDGGKLTPSFVSRYVETLTGYSEYELIYSKTYSLNALIHEQDYSEVLDQLKLAHREKDKFESSFRIVTLRGETRWVSVRGNFLSYDSPFLNSDLEGVMMDITDQVQSEEERLAITMSVEDRERKRISQEIHDGLQQTLITALFNIESIRKDIDKLDDKYIKRYTDGAKYLNQGINETRGIAHSLMPKAVSDFGFVLAVQNILNNFNKDIEVDFVENIDDLRLRPDVEIALFRITQEALTNINKYAKAKSVFIQLIYADNNINLTIEDDGIGFDPRKLMRKNKGMGLISMKNRASSVGGTFEINSSPSSGTFIMIDVPYKSSEE
jgi:PAS domain S-box-containing protein